MIIITKVINIIGKLSTHKRHYTVIPCVCKRMLFIYFFKRGGLNIFVFDINVGFKKKKQENFPRCAKLHLGLKETVYIGHYSFNEIIFKSKTCIFINKQYSPCQRVQSLLRYTWPHL